ncbi:MAG: ActS/PrrB/RegB family redox-sensitive histidine kinase [Rhodospirillaceae bacterium]|nr:ActS/PrrB/RegB family redox-sensitive histidine kinase [Rhodospirillaceae bacterium]
MAVMEANVGPLESALPELMGRLRRRTLINIRWIALIWQALTILVVRYWLSCSLPVIPCLAVIGASAILNVAATAQGRPNSALPDRDASLFLAYDIVQLSALLFLTGGIANPFVLLLLAPQMVAALVLSGRRTTVLTGLTVICIAALTLWPYPLPWPDSVPAESTDITYRVGVWVAMTLATVFVSAYVWRVAEEARKTTAALAETRLALAREQQVSEVGGLAAAAAHELGTPLGTIVLAATELADDLATRCPEAEDLHADATLLVNEARRCRDILTRLTRDPRRDVDDPFERLTLPALIEMAVGPFTQPGKDVRVEVAARDDSRPPLAPRQAEMVHGLGNLLQNAIQFARTCVSVRADWSKETVNISILDDGPGYPASVIHRLGEPYVSGRSNGNGTSAGEHMGLGIFIAVALLGRTGANVSFSNVRRGGAHVMLVWPRERFEERV